MTQTPHDQLAKQYLEEFLASFGKVERQYEVPGEAKQVDVWFVPHSSADQSAPELGILGRMTQGMCLLEPQDYPRRETVLQLLASWKVRMDISELNDFGDREESMALSEAFLAWERETESKGRQEGRQEGKVEVALNLLRENISLETIARTTGLAIEQIHQLQAQVEQK